VIDLLASLLPVGAPRDAAPAESCAAAGSTARARGAATSGFADVLDEVRSLVSSVDAAKASYAEHQKLAASLLEELQRLKL